MFSNRGKAAGIDTPPLSNGPESRARKYPSEEPVAAPGIVNRRPPARRLGGFPWRQLGWSALAGALVVVLAGLALVWAGWASWGRIFFKGLVPGSGVGGCRWEGGGCP